MTSVVGPGICLRRAAVFLNVFLERRRAGRRAVNLEDDHHSTNKDPHQESGGLMEKPYIWKANPEDNQDSTIKDSSHT
ncbi:unnamed protein product [Boreogadus saida]